MSYLNVEDIYKKLLEDAHQRKVQKVKVESSPKRNDKDGKNIIPNILGSYTTFEDRLEAVLRAGTINQNLEQLRMNRLALKRGMNHAEKNPKMNYSNLYSISNKTPIDPRDASAMAHPYQNAITINANYDPVANFISKFKKEPTVEQIRLVLAALMMHEQSHIIFINWIERKYGKSMKREIVLRSEEATYNYRMAISNYASILREYKFDVNHPKVQQAKKDGAFAEYMYLTDPLEKIAYLIESDMQTYDDIDVINRNLSKIYKIISNGVKDIKTGRR